MLKKRCKTFRCPNVHTNKNGYCDECSRKYARERSDNSEQNRATAQQRGYDWRWRMFSQQFLRKHPVCVLCGKPATCTDHKNTPAEIMLDLYGRFDLNEANYQALCTRCNTIKGYDDKIKVE